LHHLLFASLGAALLLPPRALATPPPQGWEERNELRLLLPLAQRDLETQRKTVDQTRLEVARVEINLQHRPDADDERYLVHKRRSLYAMERRQRQMEEEVARIKRRLGLE
jgi:hypothetical protein